MEETSTTNIYKSFFKRPRYILMLFISIAFYWGILAYFFPKIFLSPFSFLFERKPQLKIEISATEKYNVGTNVFTIKRIKVINESRSLNKLNINIKAPESIEDLRLNTTPIVQCTSRKLGVIEVEGMFGFEILCDSFMRDQQVEINLTTTKTVDKKENLLVEAIGSYGQDKYVGSSATGSLQ